MKNDYSAHSNEDLVSARDHAANSALRVAKYKHMHEVKRSANARVMAIASEVQARLLSGKIKFGFEGELL